MGQNISHEQPITSLEQPNASQEQPDTSSPSMGKKPTDEPQSQVEASLTTSQDADRMTGFDELKTSGPLTPREVDLLEGVVENYRQSNGLDQVAVNNLIQDSSRSSIKSAASLWAEICSALPRRQRAGLQKAARRKFHNYEKRGRWTHEEDEALRQAYQKNPQKWKVIGASIGRFPEDCRDRYRNYLRCGESQHKDVWNAEETQKFKEIVHQLLDKLRTEQASKTEKADQKTTATSEDDVERLLDWDIVSERMGRTRSRLQCRNKWEILKESEFRDKAIEQAHQKHGQDSGKSPRYLQAKTNYDLMLPGDKFKIINIIRSSLIDADRRYEFEIPWLQMQKATDDECKWTVPERKICLQEMKKVVTPPKGGGFLGYLEAMLNYMEEKYPDEIDTYYEGKLDYVYTTVPKQRRSSHKFAQSGNVSISNSATDDETQDKEGEEAPAVGASSEDKEMTNA